MSVGGKKIKEMDRAVFIGRMVINMKVNLKTVDLMVKVYWHTPTVIGSLGAGTRVSWMGKPDYRKNQAK